MWLWILLIWLGCGVCGYILCRLADFVLETELNIKYDTKDRRVWTNGDLVLCMFFSLLGGPVALIFGVFGCVSYSLSLLWEYKTRKLNKNPDSWWNKKSSI